MELTDLKPDPSEKLNVVEFLLGMKDNQNEWQRKYDVAGMISRKELNLAKPIWTRLTQLYKVYDNLTDEQKARYNIFNKKYEELYP